MIRPPTASEVTARYGIQLLNCNSELGRLRFCDAVLVLDTNVAPWREYFVRAHILTVDSDWQLFTLAYNRYFDCIIYGNNRLPSFVIDTLLKQNGLLVKLKDDYCYRCNIH